MNPRKAMLDSQPVFLLAKQRFGKHGIKFEASRSIWRDAGP